MSVSQPVDSSILHEIVRIIESRRKVPEKVVVKSREYLLTYLDDHQRRMEEALTRFDADRLNMLYGQLASKIKYQLLRRVPAHIAETVGLSPPAKAKKSGPGKAAAARPAARVKPVSRPSAPTRKAAPKRTGRTAGKVAKSVKSTGAKRTGAKRSARKTSTSKRRK